MSVSGWFEQRRTVLKADLPEVERAKYLPFDRVALRVYRVGLALAPSWLLLDAAKKFQTTGDPEHDRATFHQLENRTAWYVAVWFVILVGIWQFSPSDDLLAKLLAGLVLFRLLEIATAILGFVLDQREPRIARSLITIAVLALQIALIFAIVDHAFARNDYFMQAVRGSGGHGGYPAHTPFEYLYLSLTCMVTLGNQYIPLTGIARYLEVAATTVGLLLLGIVAARAIGLIGSTTPDSNAPGSAHVVKQGE